MYNPASGLGVLDEDEILHQVHAVQHGLHPGLNAHDVREHLRVYFVGFPFLFMYNILSTMFTSIGESKIPLGLLIFSSILNILMDLWMVAGLGLGVFGAAIATLIAQGISAVFSFLIFFARMQQYKSPFNRFERQELYSMLRIAVPSVLQQSTVSIGMMIVQAVVNPFGTQALAGYTATMRVENVFSLIFVSIGNAVSPYVSQNLGAKKIDRIKNGRNFLTIPIVGKRERLPILQLRTLYQVNYSLKCLLVDDTDIGSVTLRSLEKLRLHLLIVYVLLLCHATTLV